MFIHIHPCRYIKGLINLFFYMCQAWSNASLSIVSKAIVNIFKLKISSNLKYKKYFNKKREKKLKKSMTNFVYMNEQICINQSYRKSFHCRWPAVVNILDYIFLDNPIWALILENPRLVSNTLYVNWLYIYIYIMIMKRRN